VAPFTVLPLTSRLAARLLVVPLANRTAAVAEPAAAAFAVNWAWPLEELVPLQKPEPEPENPERSLSIVPVQTAGEVSAS
jgi:hypothetical protein